MTQRRQHLHSRCDLAPASSLSIESAICRKLGRDVGDMSVQSLANFTSGRYSDFDAIEDGNSSTCAPSAISSGSLLGACEHTMVYSSMPNEYTSAAREGAPWRERSGARNTDCWADALACMCGHRLGEARALTQTHVFTTMMQKPCAAVAVLRSNCTSSSLSSQCVCFILEGAACACAEDKLIEVAISHSRKLLCSCMSEPTMYSHNPTTTRHAQHPVGLPLRRTAAAVRSLPP